MEIQIIIEVTKNSLAIEVPEASYQESIFNGMVLNRATGQILSIGKTLHEYETQATQQGATKQSELEFVPIYDEKDFRPKQTCNVLAYYLAIVYKKLRPWASRTLGWLDTIECDLSFPNYHTVAPEKRFLFEADVQQRLSLSDLTINGQKKGWGYWQREVAANSFVVLQIVALLISATLPYIVAIQIFSLPLPTAALLFALLIISSLWASSKLIPILWIIGAGKIIPKELMRYALEFSNGVGGKKRKLSPREMALIEKYGEISQSGT